jgi:uncharacterized protein YjbJ (UPF0337 family)
MNRDEIKGKIDELKGNVKKRIGGATDDPKTQAEGWVEEKKGKIQGGIGKLEKESDKAERRDPDDL